MDRVRDILDRLEPTLAEQGLAVEPLALEGSTLSVRARRTGPGMPAAFLVRLLEGTFRRYAPEVASVRLEEYETPAAAVPAATGPAAVGIPAIDLSGQDRRRAARALEAFVALALRRGARIVKVRGLAEDPARRAAEKWADFYRDTFRSRHPEAGVEGAWVVHFDRPCDDPACTAGQPTELMPAPLFLT